jgi:hypothetical protein
MNWHTQTTRVASGEDPLLLGGRSTRLPRIDLIAGVLLAAVSSIVGVVTGFAQITGIGEDISPEPPALQAQVPTVEPAPALEADHLASVFTNIELVEDDMNFDLSSENEWRFITDSVAAPPDFQQKLDRLMRLSKRPGVGSLNPPLTCTTDGATFN